jgi:hypothetical protein
VKEEKGIRKKNKRFFAEKGEWSFRHEWCNLAHLRLRVCDICRADMTRRMTGCTGAMTTSLMASQGAARSKPYP